VLCDGTALCDATAHSDGLTIGAGVLRADDTAVLIAAQAAVARTAVPVAVVRRKAASLSLVRRGLPGPGRVARENGVVHQAEDAAGLPARQSLGVIRQQPAERCRPQAGKERFDRPERDVNHGHHEEQGLPRGRDSERPGTGRQPSARRPGTRLHPSARRRSYARDSSRGVVTCPAQR
jgi:hypothetical protein